MLLTIHCPDGILDVRRFGARWCVEVQGREIYDKGMSEVTRREKAATAQNGDLRCKGILPDNCLRRAQNIERESASEKNHLERLLRCSKVTE